MIRRNEEMRQKINLFIMLSMLLIATTLFAKPIELMIDGQMIQTEVAPMQEAGVTLVPLRVVSEELGAKVDYNAKNKGITVTKGNQIIKLTIGSPKVTVGHDARVLDVAPKMISGTTMVPIRFISENLDCKVDWDAVNKRVVIVSQDVATALPIATIKIQGIGEIKAELYPELAPQTVTNFISLANNKFYDGLSFHRVISDFMIQGGCPLGTGTGGPGYSIPGEFASNGFTTNTLAHTEGVLSMARSGMPDSAGSQFFIMTSHATHLDGAYAGFGKVIEGMEIVNQIEATETGRNDKPTTPIVIESIRVDCKGVTYPEPTKLK